MSFVSDQGLSFHPLLKKCYRIVAIQFVPYEQAPGWVKRELVECSLGRAARAESSLVTRGCARRVSPSHFPLASFAEFISR